MIHDVLGMSYRQADGSMRRVKLNAVSVTPLLPMLYGKDGSDLHRPHDQHRADPPLSPRHAPHLQEQEPDIEPMKITDIQFGMLRVPLKTPFKTALRTVSQVEDIVVMVHTDSGHIGYGEAPATAVITGDTHGSIVDAIRHYISPRLIGQDVADLNRLTGLIQSSMEKNSSPRRRWRSRCTTCGASSTTRRCTSCWAAATR